MLENFLRLVLKAFGEQLQKNKGGGNKFHMKNTIMQIFQKNLSKIVENICIPLLLYVF